MSENPSPTVEDFEDDIPFFGKTEKKAPEQGLKPEEGKQILGSMSDEEREKYKKNLIAKDEKEKKLTAYDLQRNDTGNAEHFIDERGASLTYCMPWKSWLVWNGKKWELDETGKVQVWAKQCMKDLFIESYNTRDSKMKEWAWQSGNRSRLEAFTKLAESEPGIPRKPEDYDSNPNIINLENGIYDLEKGKILSSDRAQYCTKLAGAEYDPEADCDLWCDFLERIMDGNTDLIAFLQRAVGYSLSGDTREQCFFVLQGPGANGKSTFINVLLGILGDYGAQLRSETIAAHRLDQIPTDIARLCQDSVLSRSRKHRKDVG